MEIICHRRNTLNQLNSTPYNFGVEVDIRSNGEKLIIHHDPFKKGVEFSKWISKYNHGTLIVNIKEEGLEDKILFYLNKYQIKSFFFLDQSLPFIIKMSNNGFSNSAVRVSNYESIETALNFKNKVKWIWVDIFEKFPLDFENYNNLKSANFKLCLVSPELHQSNTLSIDNLKNSLNKQKILFDAVCTKLPEKWI